MHYRKSELAHHWMNIATGQHQPSDSNPASMITLDEETVVPSQLKKCHDVHTRSMDLDLGSSELYMACRDMCLSAPVNDARVLPHECELHDPSMVSLARYLQGQMV